MSLRHGARPVSTSGNDSSTGPPALSSNGVTIVGEGLVDDVPDVADPVHRLSAFGLA